MYYNVTGVAWEFCYYLLSRRRQPDHHICEPPSGRDTNSKILEKKVKSSIVKQFREIECVNSLCKRNRNENQNVNNEADILAVLEADRNKISVSLTTAHFKRRIKSIKLSALARNKPTCECANTFTLPPKS